jgi:dTDP-4-dehydrorhamnose reductase
MKIIITGDKGFVGQETTKLLEDNGHAVYGFDLMDGYDIRDYEQFKQYCIENEPDRVLHLAAIARFADADKDPMLAHRINVLGTKNVTRVCRELHIPLVYSQR